MPTHAQQTIIDLALSPGAALRLAAVVTEALLPAVPAITARSGPKRCVQMLQNAHRLGIAIRHAVDSMQAMNTMSVLPSEFVQERIEHLVQILTERAGVFLRSKGFHEFCETQKKSGGCFGPGASFYNFVTTLALHDLTGKGPETSSRIASLLNTSRPSASVHFSKAERQGFLRKGKNADDKRAAYAVLQEPAYQIAAYNLLYIAMSQLSMFAHAHFTTPFPAMAKLDKLLHLESGLV